MKRQATVHERRHMAMVQSLGCVLCQHLGHPGTPAEVHHVRVRHGWGRSSHYSVVPLCPWHHREGPLAVHALSREAFTRVHGISELALLDLVHARLGIIDGFD